MLDVQNPEIKVDEIMQRIQERVQFRRNHPVPPQPGSPIPADSSLAFNQMLVQARDLAQVGANLPPMSRTRGLKRTLATSLGKAFLRVAQLITRDQREFNQIILGVLQGMNDRRATDLAQAAQSVQQLTARDSALAQRLEQLDTKIDDEARERRAQSLKLDQLRVATSLQERRLTLLLEEARKRLPKPLDDEQLKNFAGELPHVSDAGYLAFEDTFRGSTEEIKERVSVYLPKLRSADAGTERAPILDLGCGRGELLELLGEQGLKASGVDSNSAAVDKCRERKLDVTLGDAFELLAKTADGSLGALTALHVVEHLPFPLVLRLLDEALRVLRPGGLVVLETPNPNNILVGATNFYVDPTHRNPVHPLTLQYLVESRGFVRVETMMLHPYAKEMRIPEETAVARTFNDYFYGPQDYAVLGRRP